MVDDGSRDNTVEQVLGCVEQLPVTLIQLSRNFGKEIALTAGIDHAEGDVAVLIDGDFQHPPEHVPEFLQHWHQGYDMVYSVRSSRDNETPGQAPVHPRVLRADQYWLQPQDSGKHSGLPCAGPLHSGRAARHAGT
ncbi:glycosyltransferase [Paludibacterium denitrificans]|uniref:glycosyltransferase n=1 Tax=Paludibacterium denitrificans TaxID=2675226 RepID=UPI001E3BDF6D|nr:glycosyltransferase [Paludibacterium denitrificans]